MRLSPELHRLRHPSEPHHLREFPGTHHRMRRMELHRLRYLAETRRLRGQPEARPAKHQMKAHRLRHRLKRHRRLSWLRERRKAPARQKLAWEALRKRPEVSLKQLQESAAAGSGTGFRPGNAQGGETARTEGVSASRTVVIGIRVRVQGRRAGIPETPGAAKDSRIVMAEIRSAKKARPVRRARALSAGAAVTDGTLSEGKDCREAKPGILTAGQDHRAGMRKAAIMAGGSPEKSGKDPMRRAVRGQLPAMAGPETRGEMEEGRAISAAERTEERERRKDSGLRRAGGTAARREEDRVGI